MFSSFAEIERFVLDGNMKKRLALAGSHDRDALEAVVSARRRGAAEATLVGDEAETRRLLEELGEHAGDYDFVDEPDGRRCAGIACDLVAKGEADIPMKGIIQTAEFMHAILDKTRGFVPEKALISQATVAEYPAEKRMFIVTDCAVNIAPEYPDKVKIVCNAVRLAHRLHNPCPKVAVVAPVEVINPGMPSTVEAAMLSKAAQRGQIKNCIIDGPLGLDNAVSREAAQHKGIVSNVAGEADILVMPDLCAGNIFTKSLTYFAKLPTAGTVNGTAVPVVMTSRTDSSQDKYHSILTAILQAL